MPRRRADRSPARPISRRSRPKSRRCAGPSKRPTAAALLRRPDRSGLVGEYADDLGPHGDVLAKLRGIDLVERIVGRVVEIEVAQAVLVEIDHAGFLLAGDVDVLPAA